MSTMTSRTFLAGLGIAVIAALPGSLGAQATAQMADGRWLPFVGCWEAVGDEEDMGLLCFRPSAEGVELTSYVGGEAASTELLVADGRQQPVSVEGCEGWESVEFSEDGRRVFTSTEFLCGTEETRSGTGVMAFVERNRWADIRTLEAGDEPFAWVQEYRLASPERIAEAGADDPAQGLGMAVRSARAVAAASLDLDDVVEASGRMDPQAVETWLLAKGDRFQATGDDLMALADAGVSENVIDAVVAVSNPDRFAVQADGQVEEFVGAPRYTGFRGYMGFRPFWGPRWGLSYGYGYSPYLGYPGWGYPGYGYGYGYGYWGYRPGYVIIDRGSNGGRIYNGRGYSSPRSSGGRIARPRGGSGQPSYGTSGSRGRSSGGSGARRSAQPRGGNPPAARRSGGGGSPPAASPSSGGRRAQPRGARRRPGGGSGAY